MVVQEPEDNRRCRKIFDDFKTGRANDFQRISNQSRALFKGREDVVRTSQTFLSNYTRYCLLGVRNQFECVNLQACRRLAFYVPVKVNPDPPPTRDMWGFSWALSRYWQLFESPVCGGFAHFVTLEECGALVGDSSSNPFSLNILLVF